MPGQTAKSSFSFGAAAKAHAKDETSYGIDFTKLPSGIGGGRARVSVAKIGVYKSGDREGKRFVYLGASVLKPLKHVEAVKEFRKGPVGNSGGYPVKVGGAVVGHVVITGRIEREVQGLQTSQMFSIEADDARGTAEENTSYMLNELRRTMGDDSFTSPLAECKTEEQSWKVLEALLAKIKEEKPIIKFSTTDLDPREPGKSAPVFENWHGRAEVEPASPEAAAGMNGHSGTVPAQDMQDNTAPANGQTFDETANDQLVPADDDWDGWVEKWTKSDDGSGEQDEAVDKLTAIAVAAGIDEEAVKDAPDWDAVKAMIDEAGATQVQQEPDAAEPEPPAEPSKGDVMYATLPKDPKDAKKGKAKTAVLIETVNKKNSTVTGKNNATKKPIVGKDGKPLVIPFAELTVD